LDIYGEGPLRKVIQKQIIKYNLEEYVNLHNFLPNKEIIKEVCNSDIVILPSLYEAFPISYLETMCCSKPMITFNYPFAKEIIKNNKTGVLVRKKEISSLAIDIINLIKDKKLREKISKNAKIYVRDNFNLDDIANKYFICYKEVLKK
jgi:glycosyltransferase involved in cell wall biosynthesis